MPPEGRDTTPGVDQHRHRALVGERDEVPHDRLVEPEPLGPRVELDAARARVEAAPRLVHRSGRVRVDPGEGHEPPVGRRDGREHHVVGGRVAVGLVHREDGGARAGVLEHREQLLRALLVAVGIVGPEVRVGVVERERAGVGRDAVEPGEQDGIGVDHGRGPYSGAGAGPILPGCPTAASECASRRSVT